MRFPLILSVTCAAFLTSCAYEGVIVQKDARPLPFTHTAGIEGSYAFLLRDNSGTVRRQIVTPEVYNQYAVGEYFNDLQPPSSSGRDPIDAKVVRTAMRSNPQPAEQIASARKPNAKQKLTAKASAKSNAVAKKSRGASGKAKVAGSKPAVAVPKAVTVATIPAPVLTKAAPAAARPPVVATSPATSAAKTKPTAPATLPSNRAAVPVVRPTTTPASGVARTQKSSSRTEVEPYVPPTPAEPTGGFITVARCR